MEGIICCPEGKLEDMFCEQEYPEAKGDEEQDKDKLEDSLFHFNVRLI
jgi:hypothetical protein